MTLKERPGASIKGRPLNYAAGFRPVNSSTTGDGILRESFSKEIIPEDFGFDFSPTPRTERSVSKLN